MNGTVQGIALVYMEDILGFGNYRFRVLCLTGLSTWCLRNLEKGKTNNNKTGIAVFISASML